MATKQSETPARSIAVDTEVADRLLDLLGTDDAFRRLFKKDPIAALAQIGYKFPSNHPEAKADAPNLAVSRLASKARIIKSRKEIRNMSTAGLWMIPIQLNVESSTSRRVHRPNHDSY